MKLSKMKFSPVATVQAFVAVLIFPIAIGLWTSGWSKMKYYKGFENALTSQNSGYYGNVSSGVSSAQKAGPTASSYNLKAMSALHKKNYAAAEGAYNELTDFSYDPALPEVGKIVTQMYQTHSLPLDQAISKLEKLEKVAGTVSRENSENLDIKVVLAQIYLRKFTLMEKAGKSNLPYNLVNLAKSNLDKVLKIPYQEEQSYISQDALASLYAGKAIANFYLGKKLYNEIEKPIQKSNPKANQIFNYFLESARSFRSAWRSSLRTPREGLMVNALSGYAFVLSLPWLDKPTREEIMDEADKLKSMLERFSSHLRTLDEKVQADAWGIRKEPYQKARKQLDYMHTVSYYYLGDLQLAITKLKSNDTYMVNNIALKLALQDKFEKIATGVKADNVFPRGVVRYYTDSVKKLQATPVKSSKDITPEMLTTLNNFLALAIWRQENYKDEIKVALGLLKKYASKYNPTITNIKGDKTLTSKRVIYHNLYCVYAKLRNKREMSRYKRFFIR